MPLIILASPENIRMKSPGFTRHFKIMADTARR